MTYLPPAIEAKAALIRSIHGDAVIYWTGTGWDARAAVPGEVPDQPDRPSPARVAEAKRLREKAGKRRATR